MHSHRFTTGELVSLSEKRFPGLVWTGEWHIMGLLADADGQPQYRIQSPDKLRERVVGEQELTVRVADRRAYSAA